MTAPASVTRNLEALLEATCLEGLVDLSRLPAVRRSILNFGIPCFAGHTPESLRRSGFEARVRDAVLAFEPRLQPESVRVQLHVESARYACLPLSITAVEHASGRSVRLTVDLDLDCGTTRS